MSENDSQKHAPPKKEILSFGASDPTDGRDDYDWKSKYPTEARNKINVEAIVLVALFFISLGIIVYAKCGFVARSFTGLSEVEAEILTRILLTSFSGFLAGLIYAMKYLYHAVGRGKWHEDRRLWRFISPVMSLGVAFVIGALVETGLIDSDSGNLVISHSSLIAIGFIAGYFSDAAIAKMYEVANVIFGTSSVTGGSGGSK